MAAPQQYAPAHIAASSVIRVADVSSGVPVSPHTDLRQRSGRSDVSGTDTPSSSRTAHDERLLESAAFSNFDSPLVACDELWSFWLDARQIGTWHSSTITRSYTKYSRGTPFLSSANDMPRSAASASSYFVEKSAAAWRSHWRPLVPAYGLAPKPGSQIPSKTSGSPPAWRTLLLPCIRSGSSLPSPTVFARCER